MAEPVPSDNSYKSVAALIVAAGQGTRAGEGEPKQYREIAGKPVLRHAAEALLGHDEVAMLWVVVAPGEEARVAAMLDGLAVDGIVAGGASRRESVSNGLEAIAATHPPAYVLIHDAARPFLPDDVTDRLLAALDSHHGVIPALPVADTLVRGDGVMGDNESRDGLWRVQTPQAFHFNAVLAAHRGWPGDREATDDAQMVRAAGHDVALVQGAASLEKLTYAEDFRRAEAMMGHHDVTKWPRVGSGYDVHRLVVGEELWLGGVRIEHDKGLLGHSDADVLLHAMTDAILGAVSAGDIGQHFSPHDARWRGASSDRFLVHALELAADAGYALGNADLTIICEAPKIGPHRETIRARIAEIAGCPLDRISLKATTTEKLGFTGRGEGIAAEAVVMMIPASSL